MIESFDMHDLWKGIWPRKCGGCGTLLTRDETLFCHRCQQSLIWLGRWPLGREHMALNWGFSLYLYNHVLRNVIQAWKYRHRRMFGRLLSMELSASLPINLWMGPSCREAWEIIPIPSHVHRLGERGYDHIYDLAKGLAHRHRMAFNAQSLIRMRYHKRQVGLNREERWKNVAESFEIRRPIGKYIWLIDDVSTTGATAEACAKVLKLHGAQKIGLITLAKVLT